MRAHFGGFNCPPTRRNYNTRSFFLHPTDPFEICRLILRLKAGKSTGLDSIPNRVLRACAEPLSIILANILNKVFETGEYPSGLKIAKVVPIFKGGCKEICGNYRPVSILTGINKVFETAINDRIVKFLTKTNFLASTQYGFRKLSNTTIAAFEAMNFLYKNLDRVNCKLITGLFIDLSKAFDLVSHEILLQKLFDAGFRGPLHRVLQSYLFNRQQHVEIQGRLSGERTVESGVPQGSVLGPTLFLIFINDLSLLPLKGRVFLYADDATLFYPGRSRMETCTAMNHDLELLSSYFRTNLLVLNKSKTKFVHFHDRHQVLDAGIPVLVDGELVEEVESVTHLGLVLDCHLTWSEHCNMVAKKVSAGVAAIFQCRDFLPSDVLLCMYHSFVHSHLCYMVGLWGAADAVYLKPLQVLQNRALRMIYRVPRLTPRVELYLRHAKTVLPIKALHRFYVLKYMKQCLNNETHNTLEYRLKRRISGLRDNYRLDRPPVRTGYGERQIEFCGPSFFNRLPQEVRKTMSTSSFVARVKGLLLSTDQLHTYFV